MFFKVHVVDAAFSEVVGEMIFITDNLNLSLEH